MQRRILLAETSRPVVSAVRRHAAALGLKVDAAAPKDAAEKFHPGRHALAIVRATGNAPEVVAALRRAEPRLPVLALFHDEDEVAAAPDGLVVDGALVGPLTAAEVVGTCRMALRLRDAEARAEEAEARAARSPRASADLDFLKRLLMVEVRRSRRYRYPVSLLLVGLDGWAERAAGLAPRDRLAALADVLGVIVASIRDIDVAVPFADDRFLVLAPHTGREGALLLAGRICARVGAHAGLVRVTASAGVAAHGGEGTVSFGTLVARAAEALSRAQAAGGGRAEAADPPKRRSRIVMG